MEKIKEFFKSENFFAIILAFLGLRACLTDFSIGQALAIGFFAAGYSFKKWLEYNTKPDLNEAVQKELAEMRTITSGLAMKNASKPSQMKQELEHRRFF